MCADYRVYAQALRQSPAVVASDCAFLAYTGAYQLENIYKDELYHSTTKECFQYIQGVPPFLGKKWVIREFHTPGNIATFKEISTFEIQKYVRIDGKFTLDRKS